jgi:hypothetical protein
MFEPLTQVHKPLTLDGELVELPEDGGLVETPDGPLEIGIFDRLIPSAPEEPAGLLAPPPQAASANRGTLRQRLSAGDGKILIETMGRCCILSPYELMPLTVVGR